MMTEKKTYPLAITIDKYERLQEIAREEGTTFAELLRRAVRWLLFVQSIKQDPDAHLLIQRDGEIREIAIDLVL
jgi:hypothetical protein